MTLFVKLCQPLTVIYLGGTIPFSFPDDDSGSFIGLEFGFITLAGTEEPNDFTS